MIRKVKLNQKEIILVGTAHISQESINLVEKTIEEEKPDIIGVELDQERLQQLLSGSKWEQTNLVEIVKTGKTYLFLLNILLSNLQKQLGAKVGVKPGAEMLIAIKKAQEQKIPIQLLDRNVKITLKRAMKEMTLKEKLKLASSIIMGFFGKANTSEVIDIQKIEDLKNEDLINKLMKELGKQMPSVKKVLVDERDDYITEMIRNSPGKKIVAVVGAGHLNGIVENLKKEKKVDLKKLVLMPKKRNYLKYLKYFIPILFFSFIGFLLASKGIETTINALIIWFIANGVCSAIGAIAARAHPISVLTAFFAAPITSLHPAIAAGWITALTETRFNSPRVIDFENLSNISTIKGFYQNKVSHILIVTALTNVGSMIGTIIAVPYLIVLLA
ncbi:MAG: TraB/GumN family protein [Candidatus ainarchaeum sp.]|nr:TraB/GumN family protein [Candidatus ainarchaeum sp.]